MVQKDCFEVNGSSTGKGGQVTLESIIVEAKVQGFAADIHSTLTFVNTSDDNLDNVVVTFPIDDSTAGSLYDFKAIWDGKVLQGHVEERILALGQCSEGLTKSGQDCLILEMKKYKGSFVCHIGSVTSGQQVVISVSTVQTLAVSGNGGAVEFLLPSFLLPNSYTALSKQGMAHFDLTIHIDGPYQIHDVRSEEIEIVSEYLNSSLTQAKVSFLKTNILTARLSIFIFYYNLHQPKIIIEKGHPAKWGVMYHDVLMLTFCPQIPTSEIRRDTEFIFVVDCSDFMAGDKILSARRSLLLLLKSLPLDSTFNVVVFGDHYYSLFDGGSRPYNRATLEKAVAFLEDVEPDMGDNTSLLRTLKHIYRQDKMGKSRQLFLLTSGAGATIMRDVKEMVQRHALGGRTFVFGLGDVGDQSLLKEIAIGTGGTCNMIRDTRNLEEKVMSVFKKALLPEVRDLSLHWELPEGTVIHTTPHRLPLSLMAGDTLVVHTLIKTKLESSAYGIVYLQGELDDDPFYHSLKFEIPQHTDPTAATSVQEATIHRLAAKSLICDLEQQLDGGANILQGNTPYYIIRLSKASNIVSRCTAILGKMVGSEDHVQLLYSDWDKTQEADDTTSIGSGDSYEVAIREYKPHFKRVSSLWNCGLGSLVARKFRSMSFSRRTLTNKLTYKRRMVHSAQTRALLTPERGEEEEVEAEVEAEENCIETVEVEKEEDTSNCGCFSWFRVKFRKLVNSIRSVPHIVKIRLNKSPSMSDDFWRSPGEAPSRHVRYRPKRPKSAPLAEFGDEMRVSLASVNLINTSGTLDDSFMSNDTQGSPQSPFASKEFLLEGIPESPTTPVLKKEYLLAECQGFDGSWCLDAALAEILDTSVERMIARCPCPSQSVWATVLAVVWLQRNAGQHSEWTFIKKKALDWLNSQCIHSDSLLDLAGTAADVLRIQRCDEVLGDILRNYNQKDDTEDVLSTVNLGNGIGEGRREPVDASTIRAKSLDREVEFRENSRWSDTSNARNFVELSREKTNNSVKGEISPTLNVSNKINMPLRSSTPDTNIGRNGFEHPGQTYVSGQSVVPSIVQTNGLDALKHTHPSATHTGGSDHGLHVIMEWMKTVSERERHQVPNDNIRDDEIDSLISLVSDDRILTAENDDESLDAAASNKWKNARYLSSAGDMLLNTYTKTNHMASRTYHSQNGHDAIDQGYGKESSLSYPSSNVSYSAIKVGESYVFETSV
ncbi:von Willebrand factor A domain-containing protein 5A isoform X2 [Lingula anatina]|uniref:von Willebrand factor A domain-containing protein 5A isoform X2 n=1 Tax=Lingula anatina TaxID=7574 RepID=A0A1S3HI55_LINAN|nr:von Willebrand factor A domain-containing protein 5A isoform X2 [Lingula anatina]|eukprot:XP_013385702.1 von Willebrand factor A domain-containing protein 5A isoform X2 [Lingula anatina]